MKGGYDKRRRLFNLSFEIARRVYNNNNQYAKILIMGATGRGKSYAALVLAYCIALWFSYFEYGDYKHWREYFDIEKNLVVASKKRMVEAKNNLKKFSIIIFDEIQKGHNARDWRDKESMELLDLFQVKRTKRFVLIGTIQEQFAQDKQARNLYDYFIDMGELDDWDHGINYCKVFRGRLRPRNTHSKSVHFRSPKDHSIKWILCALGLPPKPMWERYEILRDTGLAAAEKEKRESQEERDERANGRGNNKRSNENGNSSITTCPECFSNFTYVKKKTNTLACRNCGKETKMCV